MSWKVQQGARKDSLGSTRDVDAARKEWAAAEQDEARLKSLVGRHCPCLATVHAARTRSRPQGYE